MLDAALHTVLCIVVHIVVHACAGTLPAGPGARKAVCLERLLSVHFKYEGITYRDCIDAAQAGAHVVGITSAIATQAYKVRPDRVAAGQKDFAFRLLVAAGQVHASCRC
jgi:hypothetical protein